MAVPASVSTPAFWSACAVPGAAVTAGRVLLVAAAALAFAGAALAETYKWVDEKGVVHYTDKMPPEQVNKAATVLDKQARPIKQIEPPPTPAQRAARDAEEQRTLALAKEREAADRKDRALMQSFTSPEEIELSKSRAVATIDGQLQSAHAYIAQLGKRREEVEARRVSYGSKPVPESLEREIASIDVEVQKQNDLVIAHQQERAQTIARYDAFGVRWRALKAEADAKAAGGAPPPGNPAAVKVTPR
jgi:hypothetical protein